MLPRPAARGPSAGGFFPPFPTPFPPAHHRTVSLTSSTFSQIAAWTAAFGFAAMAAFQLLLAFGAPLGHLAWGGRHRRLPAGLRLGSLLSAGVFAFAILIVLERAGVVEGTGRPGLVSVAVWVLAGLFGLSALGNAASSSRWERRVMTPVALVLCAACVVVALSR